MEVEYSIVRFENISMQTRQGDKLRGYFANKYKENELIHNHRGDKLIYQYPKIQYKVIEGIPLVCGIEEGARLICGIGFETDSIFIDKNEMEVFQKEFIKSIEQFEETGDYITYKFLTPWIALNQKNIHVYESSNNIEREDLLKRILTGNILSMAKGLNYNVLNKIHVWLDVKECETNFKNIRMKAFKGTFKVNFLIPDYLGLGKSVSRGFGTIKRS